METYLRALSDNEKGGVHDRTLKILAETGVQVNTEKGRDILQAAGARITKTEYIACPSCGRTHFDIQSRLKEIRNATSHLTTLKIGVMGCIVNGPGEMADADYGYVGAGPGRVSIYKGREARYGTSPKKRRWMP